ncbi:MAG: transpeptidase family protein [Prevotellaceae bacterium]|nr:transpeptidase family protein [Prevotellaceae bacterium]
MSSTHQSILARFAIVYLVMVVLFLLAIYKIVVIQVVEKDKWMAVAERLERPDKKVQANRGNIYSHDGKLMASTIPYYYLYMDTRVEALHMKNGRLFKDNIDSLSLCLSRKFGDRSAGEYRRYITRAYQAGKGNLLLYPKKITYSELKEIKKFPLFRLGRNKSGLIEREYVKRIKPFGSLASRTIGNIYGEGDKGGQFGLELAYDSLLRGKPGVAKCELLGNRWVYVPVVEPQDGLDVTTTLDIEMQDIAERALVDKLVEIDAASGCVLLMDVASGEVKACVNMSRVAPGDYREIVNMAVGDMSEPGSTFKTMSLMVLLEKGLVKPTDSVDTGNGKWPMYNRIMTDHNHKTGGYGMLTVTEALANSSNIGVSRLVDAHFADNPSEFVDQLYKMGLGKPMNIEIPGAGRPKIRHPKDKHVNWYKTALPWMSIGYEVQMPPIYTLAFYNAIANKGKYIRPYFVKSISQNGRILETFGTETINSSICSSSTLRDIRMMLQAVVEEGTGKAVHSDYVSIAGKTGTAQLQYGKGQPVTHQVSFCGYFPADKPMYSAIVVIRQPRNGYPSGGLMSGRVFKTIAERVYAQSVQAHMVDSIASGLPAAKAGKTAALSEVLDELNFDCLSAGETWGRVKISQNYKTEPITVSDYHVPNVVGMGAKDAVYLMERVGLRVQLYGRGKVQSQSIQPGVKAMRGQTVSLVFGN